MTRWVVTALCVSVLSVSFNSCGPSGGAERNSAPRRPEITLNIGSLNVSSYKKRIERNDLVRFSAVLKKEGIDILGVQGLTRYPGVATRTDFVEVLSSLTSMRSAFGASSDVSGRQVGHAVFAIYPVRSHVNIPFENTGSDDFESALLLVVDAGVREIQVANMLLPQKGKPDQCLETVMRRSAEDVPLILVGNLPARPSAGFAAPPEQSSTKKVSVWVPEGDSFEILSTRKAESNFGELTVVQVGLFRAQGKSR